MSTGGMTAVVDRPAQPQGWLATIAVAIMTLGIVGAGFVVSRASLGLPILPVDVGEGVRIFPPVEWRYLGPPRSGNGGEFANGVGDLIVQIDSDTNEQSVAAAVRDFLTRRGASATAIEPAVAAHGSSRAVRFSFSGVFGSVQTVVEGEVFVVSGTNTSVVFIALTGPGDYKAVEGDIAGMVSSATIP